MIPVEEYKNLREKLDDLLIEYDIPKEYWHNSQWLNANIKRLFFENTKAEAAEADNLDRFTAKVMNDVEIALVYVHKLCPFFLTRLYGNINYDRILN
jgi:hypothetical protein